MIPEGYPDPTTYSNELLRTNKPEQQSNKFWFPTSKNPVKFEDHTPIQTRIPKELYEQKEKEKLNPKYDTKYQKKFSKRFDWTNTLLTDNEKQAIGDILVD